MSIIKLSDGTLRSNKSVCFTPYAILKFKCPHCGVVYESYNDIVSWMEGKNKILCNECCTTLDKFV